MSDILLWTDSGRVYTKMLRRLPDEKFQNYLDIVRGCNCTFANGVWEGKLGVGKVIAAKALAVGLKVLVQKALVLEHHQSLTFLQMPPTKWKTIILCAILWLIAAYIVRCSL